MSSQFSSYSDASSSYWPPGWNFARYASATPADNATLSDEERAKMQAGFRDVLGEEGVAEMARVVWQEQLRVMKAEKKAKQAEQRRVPAPPNWLRAWRKKYQSPSQSWGFVGVWTGVAAAAAERMTDSGGVEEFEERVREIAEIPFEAALEEGQPAEEIAEARRMFEIRWIQLRDEKGEEGEGEKEKEKEKDENESESKAEEGQTELVEQLRARYRSMQESGTLPHGLSLPIFLVPSPSAVASVLSTPKTGEGKPGTTSPRWRSGAPFLLAVSTETELGVVDDDGEEGEADELVGRGGEKDWFKPVFRVAVEVLLDELWPVVEDQMMSPGIMTRFVQGAEVTEDTLASGHHAEDDLDAIWWSVHTPPHQMRKRRKLFTA